MCGIAGFGLTSPSAVEPRLAAGCDSLRHRGPDDSGIWFSEDRRVGLGHRRLAIIDLSPAGHQPMVDRAGELVIVFNGEIYNFKDLKPELAAKGHCFHTASDTEVLLAAYREWGLDCLSRLNGMFAFALYDSRNRTLFLARDRAGEKPLYYHHDASGVRFGSELKALLHDGAPRKIDRAALDLYLAFGYVPGERSILCGVNKLPPAHAMTLQLDSGQFRTWRYWEPPELSPSAQNADEGELLDELEALLEDAVRYQLVADVPLGVLLSGGVDSSLVTAMAVRSAPHIKTFTVRFPGHARYDETERARLIARHFQTDHVELEAGETSVEILPLLARQYDEPMVDSSMIPTFLVTRLVREHCTVALGGDGGDELFGGYDHYRRLLWLQQQTVRIPRVARRALAAVGTSLPTGVRGRNWLQALSYDLQSEVPPVEGFFDAASRRRLMVDREWATTAEQIRAARTPRSADLLQRSTRLDFENYLAEDILVKVDRASMLNSLEMRAPFLDHRVVEFAFGKVPSHLKATPSSLKVLLKRLCARTLPAGFDYDRKWGFSIPLVHWLKSGPWFEFFRDVLLDSDQKTFARPYVTQLLDSHRKGRDHGERLFALTLFELWRKEYQASL
jgi:asparagine synthase (glutamine-hydrolysing)